MNLVLGRCDRFSSVFPSSFLEFALCGCSGFCTIVALEGFSALGVPTFWVYITMKFQNFGFEVLLWYDLFGRLSLRGI